MIGLLHFWKIILLRKIFETLRSMRERKILTDLKKVCCVVHVVIVVTKDYFSALLHIDPAIRNTRTKLAKILIF